MKITNKYKNMNSIWCKKKRIKINLKIWILYVVKKIKNKFKNMDSICYENKN